MACCHISKSFLVVMACLVCNCWYDWRTSWSVVRTNWSCFKMGWSVLLMLAQRMQNLVLAFLLDEKNCLWAAPSAKTMDNWKWSLMFPVGCFNRMAPMVGWTKSFWKMERKMALTFGRLQLLRWRPNWTFHRPLLAMLPHGRDGA